MLRILHIFPLVTVLIISTGATTAEEDIGGDSGDLPIYPDDAILNEAELLKKYNEEFPESDYEIVEVPRLGKFYIDDENDYIKKMLLLGDAWEPHVSFVLEAVVEPNTTVIDVGAHIGTHTVSMCNLVGPGGKVYAFEPQRKIYRELCKNLELNGCDNAVPLRYALGSEHATIEMNPATPGNEGSTAIGEGGDEAELWPLDSFQLTNVSLIKIDVEGFEDYVLEGSQQTIESNRPIIIVEIQGGHVLETAPPEIREKVKNTIAKLEQHDYRVEKIGAYDYLAVPSERGGEINDLLRGSLRKQTFADLLKSPIVITVMLLLIVAIGLLCRVAFRPKDSGTSKAKGEQT